MYPVGLRQRTTTPIEVKKNLDLALPAQKAQIKSWPSALQQQTDKLQEQVVRVKDQAHSLTSTIFPHTAATKKPVLQSEADVNEAPVKKTQEELESPSTTDRIVIESSSSSNPISTAPVVVQKGQRPLFLFLRFDHFLSTAIERAAVSFEHPNYTEDKPWRVKKEALNTLLGQISDEVANAENQLTPISEIQVAQDKLSDIMTESDIMAELATEEDEGETTEETPFRSLTALFEDLKQQLNAISAQCKKSQFTSPETEIFTVKSGFAEIQKTIELFDAEIQALSQRLASSSSFTFPRLPYLPGNHLCVSSRALSTDGLEKVVFNINVLRHLRTYVAVFQKMNPLFLTYRSGKTDAAPVHQLHIEGDTTDPTQRLIIEREKPITSPPQGKYKPLLQWSLGKESFQLNSLRLPHLQFRSEDHNRKFVFWVHPSQLPFAIIRLNEKIPGTPYMGNPCLENHVFSSLEHQNKPALDVSAFLKNAEALEFKGN